MMFESAPSARGLASILSLTRNDFLVAFIITQSTHAAAMSGLQTAV